MTVFIWSGTLARCPYAEPAPADATLMPFRTVDDYAAVAALGRSDRPEPVWLGYAQYYRLLADLVAHLRAELAPDAPVLVELARPLGVAVPTPLLAEGVLICDDVAPPLAWWSAAGARRCVALRSRIRRDLFELGDNSLTLMLASRTDARDPLAALLRRSGVAHAFDHPPAANHGAPACRRTACPT